MHTRPVIIGFLVASLIMGAIHRRISSSGSVLAVLYCLPFTFLHELSHFVVAFLTGGRPSSLTVLPRRDGSYWVLGSVSSAPTILSAVPTALAPLGWLWIGYYTLLHWDKRPVWAPEYLLVAVLYGCTAACTPSWQDLKVALSHPFSLLLWTGIGYLGACRT